VGPGGLAAWATGGRLYRFFEVELHTQVCRRGTAPATTQALVHTFAHGLAHALGHTQAHKWGGGRQTCSSICVRPSELHTFIKPPSALPCSCSHPHSCIYTLPLFCLASLLPPLLLLLQLEVLFKRSLHKLALDLAVRSGGDAALIAAIHQRWGDHLYGKAEYEAAMGQYLNTLGHLEPSYVIRR